MKKPIELSLCLLSALLITTATLSLLSCVALPVSAATKVPSVPARYNLKAGSLFNIPKAAGGTHDQQRVFDATFKQVLDATPAGETVTVSMYSTSLDSVADKVIQTYKRGVHFRYVVWDQRVSDQVTAMQNVLGKDPTKKSYLIACKGSCLLSGSLGIQHAKGITVSRIIKKDGSSLRYISFVGSANFSEPAATSSWNHTYVITNNKAIYDSLNGYMYPMRLDKTRYDFPGEKSGAFTMYYFPRSSKNYDPVVGALRETSCKAAKGYGNKGKTVVRVSMFTWTTLRKEIATRLIELQKAGCDVAIMTNSLKEGNATPDIVTYLVQGGVPVRNSRVDLSGDGNLDIYTHAKMTVIDGTIAGKSRALVYSGSANFTENSITDNSEIIIKIDSKSVTDQARTWLAKEWSYSRSFTSSPSSGTNGQSVQDGENDPQIIGDDSGIAEDEPMIEE